MHLAVLGASGATGRQLVHQALLRGHTVTAVVRDPTRLHLPASPRLRPVVGDVRVPATIGRALQDTQVVLSGLGVAKGDRAGTLSAGAHAVVGAAPVRVVWLGAFGTGGSARAAGPLTRGVLRLALGAEVADKVAADATVLHAGGTLFHAGPLTNAPGSNDCRTVALPDLPHRLIAWPISRATVARAMLDEAEVGHFPGQLVVPLSR